MKLWKLSPTAYESYKRTVFGNEYTSFDQALRKLSRNIQLVKEYAPENIRGLFSKTYQYGKLFIHTKRGTIVKVENRRDLYTDFYVDKRRYNELSKEYEVIK